MHKIAEFFKDLPSDNENTQSLSMYKLSYPYQGDVYFVVVSEIVTRMGDHETAAFECDENGAVDAWLPIDELIGYTNTDMLLNRMGYGVKYPDDDELVVSWIESD